MLSMARPCWRAATSSMERFRYNVALQRACSARIRHLLTLSPIALSDEIHINTQSGSQWDGFKHYGHGASDCYYNGLKHDDVAASLDNGIHHWNNRGGLVGRGILLDYVRYAEKKGIKYEVMTRHQITVEAMEEMAAEQGVEFKPGDFLIVRSGFTKWYNQASQAERDQKITASRTEISWTGVEGSKKSVEWIW